MLHPLDDPRTPARRLVVRLSAVLVVVAAWSLSVVAQSFSPTGDVAAAGSDTTGGRVAALRVAGPTHAVLTAVKAFAYLPRTAGPTPVPAEARRDGHWEVDVVLPGDACVIDVHAPAPIGAYLSGVAMTVMTTWRAAAGVSTHTFLSLVPVKHPGGGSWDCGSVQLRLGPMVAESIAHWASLSTP